MTVRYMTGGLYYGEFIHATGDFSARLLIITLAVTPLRLMFPKSRWTTWLLQSRRYFGVAAFAYALGWAVFPLGEIRGDQGPFEQ